MDLETLKSLMKFGMCTERLASSGDLFSQLDERLSQLEHDIPQYHKQPKTIHQVRVLVYDIELLMRSVHQILSLKDGMMPSSLKQESPGFQPTTHLEPGFELISLKKEH